MHICGFGFDFFKSATSEFSHSKRIGRRPDKCVRWYNKHPNQDIEDFHLSRKFFCASLQSAFMPFPPQSSIIYLKVSKVPHYPVQCQNQEHFISQLAPTMEPLSSCLYCQLNIIISISEIKTNNDDFALRLHQEGVTLVFLSESLSVFLLSKMFFH